MMRSRHARGRSIARFAAIGGLLVLAVAAHARPGVETNLDRPALPAASLPIPASLPGAADALNGLLLERGRVGAPDEPIPAPAPPAGVERLRARASEMVLTALQFIGVPYRHGGTSADGGFDCSGFTRRVFETSLGLVLPRRADEQAGTPGLVAVARAQLEPGDLVFFNTLARTFSHVGIYVGEGRFVHAPRAGAEVRIDDMRSSYWERRFTGARRAEPLLAQAAVPAPRAPRAEARNEFDPLTR